MINKIQSFTKQLISIPSTKENPDMLNKVLEIAKKELIGYTIEKFNKDGVPSLLAYKDKTRPKKFKAILNAHLDVVPAKEYQYKPYEKNGRLYGRGSYDMKSAAAVETLVFKELAKKLNYPVALQLVTDEEIGGFKGTKYQLEQGVRGDFVIAGENTDLTIINRAKGIIWLKIKSTGSAAHGAYLWMGDNAIVKMNRILNTLQETYPTPKKEIWATTINYAVIESLNKTVNKVPDVCELSLDVRYISEDKNKIISYLKKLQSKDTEIEFLENEPAYFTAENNKYIQMLKNTIQKINPRDRVKILPHHGGSDVRHYDLFSGHGIEFGPKGFGLHTDDEWVDIKSLKEYYSILEQFLISL